MHLMIGIIRIATTLILDESKTMKNLEWSA